MNTQSNMDFSSFTFHPLILSGIHAVGYQKPTPIQAQAIPIVLDGHDIMGLAQTGTGKTAAFVLPILHRLLAKNHRSTRALILVPTRELAEQIYTVIKQLSQKTKLRSMTVYGGVASTPQIRKLREGVEIVVACPGRLLDHIRYGSIDLSHLELLVLDEADQMFDMGFLPNLKEIIKALPQKRQTLMFSATMPAEIRKLAFEILQQPKTIQIANTAPVNTVSHSVYLTERDKKTPLLMALLGQAQGNSVLVFTRTKHTAIRLAEQIKKAGFPSTSLQGNLSQAKRQFALDGFKRGKFQVLVATDIAARGIDVSDIAYVINYDIPDTPEAYTHRIGRTGRAEKTGEAFTLITNADLYILRIIERTIGKKIERRTIEGLSLDMSTARQESDHSDRRKRNNNRRFRTGNRHY
jgi:ATP-dependent RNA helicase RhlE